MPTEGFSFIFSISLYHSKLICEEEMKRDVIHIFKNTKTFNKYALRLSTEISFDSGIETTIIIYQIEARIKLHNIIFLI